MKDTMIGVDLAKNVFQLHAVDDWAATVQQEVVPGEVPKLYGRAAARSGCDGGLWQCALLGARDGQAWP
jgi:hypothetical protein